MEIASRARDASRPPRQPPGRLTVTVAPYWGQARQDAIRQTLRDDQLQRATEALGDPRERDPRVSGRDLDDWLTGVQLATRAGRRQQMFGEPVLDGAGAVRPLELQEPATRVSAEGVEWRDATRSAASASKTVTPIIPQRSTRTIFGAPGTRCPWSMLT